MSSILTTVFVVSGCQGPNGYRNTMLHTRLQTRSYNEGQEQQTNLRWPSLMGAELLYHVIRLVIKAASVVHSLSSFFGRSSLLLSSSSSFQNPSRRRRRIARVCSSLKRNTCLSNKLRRRRQSRRRVQQTLILSFLLVTVLSPSPRRMWVKPR